MSNNNLRNIGCDNKDQFFRYKRSSVEISYKNSGKGQTVIDNIKKISHELETKPENLIRYLKKQLNTSLDKDGVIHAKIDKEKIETEIDKYIELYVLCPRCKLPEYHMGSCNACGYKATNSSNSLTSLNDRNDKMKNYLNSKKESIVQIRVTEPSSPETVAEKKLTNEMHLLYDLRYNPDTNVETQKTIDFLLDCLWAIPDVEDLVVNGGKVSSDIYIGNIVTGKQIGRAHV